MKHNKTIKSNLYVLFSMDETNRNEDLGPAFWSNEDGWGNLKKATVFTHDEMVSFNEPFNSEWVILPDCLS